MDLPDGALSIVLNKLSAKDLSQCCCVSKLWRDVGSSDAFWQNHLNHDFHISVPYSEGSNGSRKADYRSEHLLRCGVPRQSVLPRAHSSVACLDTRNTRLLTGYEDGSVQMYELDTGKCSLAFQLDNTAYCLWSDDVTVVCGLKTGDIQIWGILDGKLRMTFSSHGAWVSCVQFDSQWVVSGSGDKNIKIWCRKTGRCVHTLVGHSREVRCLHFDYDLERVASGSADWTIRIWDMKSGACFRELNTGSGVVHCLQFDSRRLALGCCRVSSITFSSRARYGAVEVRSTGDYSHLVGLEEDDCALLCLKLRGNMLIGGGWDGLVRMWDLNSGKLIRRFLAGPTYITNLQVSNTKIVVSLGDETVRLWNFDG